MKWSYIAEVISQFSIFSSRQSKLKLIYTSGGDFNGQLVQLSKKNNKYRYKVLKVKKCSVVAFERQDYTKSVACT